MKEKIETLNIPCDFSDVDQVHNFFKGEVMEKQILPKNLTNALNGCHYYDLGDVLVPVFREDKGKPKRVLEIKSKSRYSVCKATLSIVKKLKYSVGKMEFDSLEEAEKYIKIEEITDWVCGQLILDRLPVRSVVKTLLGKYGIEPLSGD